MSCTTCPALIGMFVCLAGCLCLFICLSVCFFVTFFSGPVCLFVFCLIHVSRWQYYSNNSKIFFYYLHCLCLIFLLVNWFALLISNSLLFQKSPVLVLSLLALLMNQYLKHKTQRVVFVARWILTLLSSYHANTYFVESVCY